MFDRRAKYAWGLACLLLVCGGFGFRVAARALNVYMKKEPVPLRERLDTIATRLGDWEILGDTRKLSKEMIESLGTNDYLDRTYVRRTDGAPSSLQVHIAYYTGKIDAVPHVPDRCMVAGGFDSVKISHNAALPVSQEGWVVDEGRVNGRTGRPYMMTTHRDPLTKRSMMVRMPVTDGGFELRCSEYAREGHDDMQIHAGYLFIANGGLAVTPRDVQMLAFSKSERYAYYCKVQFTGSGVGYSEEEFAAEAGDLFTVLLPELMRCLPDWAEIESQESALSEHSSTGEG